MVWPNGAICVRRRHLRVDAVSASGEILANPERYLRVDASRDQEKTANKQTSTTIQLAEE